MQRLQVICGAMGGPANTARLRLCLQIVVSVTVLATARAQAGCQPECVNGVCQHDPGLEDSAYYCNCADSGYAGSTCAEPLPSASAPVSDPCAPGCMHGICTLTATSEAYVCSCEGYYTGDYCNITSFDSDSAASAPLQTAVSELVSSGGPAVSPPPPAPLTSTTACMPACANGGICELQDDDSTFACNCTGTSYTGQWCSISKTGTWSVPPFLSLWHTGSIEWCLYPSHR